MPSNRDCRQLIENLETLHKATKGDSEDTLKTAFREVTDEIKALYQDSQELKDSFFSKEEVLIAFIFKSVFAPDKDTRNKQCSYCIKCIDLQKPHFWGAQYQVKRFFEKIKGANIEKNWSHVKVNVMINGQDVLRDYTEIIRQFGTMR